MEEFFKVLKERFTIVPILIYFDLTKICIVETDTSDFALEAILFQKDENTKLHPIAVHSQKFQPAEINYEVHDTELLVVVDSFKG
jgi:hypothetical protein